MIPISHVLILSGILFSTGLFGILVRRNVLLILLSVELMLNAANLALIAGSSLHGNADGQVTAFFVMVVAAAEVAVGLSLAVLLFRRKESVDTFEIKWLKD